MLYNHMVHLYIHMVQRCRKMRVICRVCSADTHLGTRHLARTAHVIALVPALDDYFATV